MTIACDFNKERHHFWNFLYGFFICQRDHHHWIVWYQCLVKLPSDEMVKQFTSSDQSWLWHLPWHGTIYFHCWHCGHKLIFVYICHQISTTHENMLIFYWKFSDTCRLRKWCIRRRQKEGKRQGKETWWKYKGTGKRWYGWNIWSKLSGSLLYQFEVPYYYFWNILLLMHSRGGSSVRYYRAEFHVVSP